MILRRELQNRPDSTFACVALPSPNHVDTPATFVAAQFNGEFTAKRRLYSLAGAASHDCNGNSYLALATAANHFERKSILPDKILGRPVNGDESPGAPYRDIA